MWTGLVVCIRVFLISSYDLVFQLGVLTAFQLTSACNFRMSFSDFWVSFGSRFPPDFPSNTCARKKKKKTLSLMDSPEIAFLKSRRRGISREIIEAGAYLRKAESSYSTSGRIMQTRSLGNFGRSYELSILKDGHAGRT